MSCTRRYTEENLDVLLLMSPNEPRADYVYFCGDVAVVVEEVRGRSKREDVDKLENTVRRPLDIGIYHTIVAVIHHEEADVIVAKILAVMKQRSKKKHVKYETATCGRELRQLLCRKYGVAM
jgi:hypothetical protein